MELIRILVRPNSFAASTEAFSQLTNWFPLNCVEQTFFLSIKILLART